MNKNVYIRISLVNDDGGLTETLEGAKNFLEEMVQGAKEYKYDKGENAYQFDTVEMTEEEFKNLPEFTGF